MANYCAYTQLGLGGLQIVAVGEEQNLSPQTAPQSVDGC